MLERTVTSARRFWLRRRVELTLAAAFVAGVLFGLLVPWRTIYRRRAARVHLDESLAPAVKKARQTGLDYWAAVSKSESEILGATVNWCIDHPVAGRSYVSGNPRKKILWENESKVPINRLIKDRCFNVLALVRGKRADAVVLKFIAVRP